MRRLIIYIFPFLIITSAHGATCELKSGQIVEVGGVVDGDTVTLRSGQKVRLVGIQAPKLPLGRKNYPSWPLADISKQTLEKLVLGKEVQLRYGGRQVDRHGRLLAHLFVGSEWIQQKMIQEGMARVYSFPDNQACVEKLLESEIRARQSRKGIWTHPFYGLRSANNVEVLSNLNNNFELVEGVVLTVGRAKGKIYLNFGKDWKTDFTAVIARHHKKNFSKSEYDLTKLIGKKVRLRGWLGFYNGPTLDISHPEQIEILKR